MTRRFDVSTHFPGGHYDLFMALSGQQRLAVDNLTGSLMLAFAQMEMAQNVAPAVAVLVSDANNMVGSSTAHYTAAYGALDKLKVGVHVRMTAYADGIEDDLNRVLGRGLAELYGLLAVANSGIERYVASAASSQPDLMASAAYLEEPHIRRRHPSGWRECVAPDLRYRN